MFFCSTFSTVYDLFYRQPILKKNSKPGGLSQFGSTHSTWEMTQLN